MEEYFNSNPAFDLVERLDSTLHTEVWKAIQTNLKRTVVLHILKPESAADPREREHFLAIARSFAKIKSESVASIFDIISDADYHYVVMEYVEGPTLDDLAHHKHAVTVEQALKIGLSIASCFEQLWQGQHIIHRNLKSSVVRLDSRGIAKLVDFSLAIMQKSPHMQSTLDDGNIVGTPGFISPEQVQGVEHLTTQSDMYALGAVLYHLSTGVQPFYNADPLVTLNAQLREQLVPPHVLNPKFPTVFSWLIHRLMMKNPTNRYANWALVIQDLHLMLANQVPSCVTPQESFISTIDIAPLLKPATSKKPATKIKTKPHVVSLAEKEHHEEIRRENRIKAIVAWLILVAWLGTIFWFRAIFQKDPQALTQSETPPTNDVHAVADPVTVSPAPEREQPMETPAPVAVAPEHPAVVEPAAPVHVPTPKPTPVAAPAPATVEPPASQVEKPQATPPVEKAPPPPPPKPALADDPSETLEIHLVEAISKGDAEACIKLLSESTEHFRDKAGMLALLQKAPSVTALVEASARTLVGRPVPLLRNGRERIVTPRQVGNGIIQVEANGRTVDLPIAILTPDEKLNWIDPPATAPESFSYCLLLMQTAKRSEVEKQAENCPLFKRYLQKAAALTTSP